MTTPSTDDFQFTKKINLTDINLGTKVIFVSDDFFADCSRMLQTDEPVFISDKFDDNGKWMDGWESRRRRDGKNDYCILKLGAKSVIDGFNVDTSHFTGNFTPACAILGLDANQLTKKLSNEELVKEEKNLPWFELLPANSLNGDSHNLFHSISNKEVTHLKIIMYPDGGIARLRTHGSICFDPSRIEADKLTNVISIFHGTRAIKANDQHFGRLDNILMEHTPLSMADGWETRRRREPGFDWGIIELPQPAMIEEITVDTSFFKGNFPHSFSICAAGLKEKTTDQAVITQSMFWQEILKPQKLEMNTAFKYGKDKIEFTGPITHIRVNLFPDGGISRLKLMGKFTQN